MNESPDEISALGLLADIRAAVGDPEGKLMQDELVAHCKALHDRVEALSRVLHPRQIGKVYIDYNYFTDEEFEVIARLLDGAIILRAESLMSRRAMEYTLLHSDFEKVPRYSCEPPEYECFIEVDGGKFGPVSFKKATDCGSEFGPVSFTKRTE